MLRRNILKAGLIIGCTMSNIPNAFASSGNLNHSHTAASKLAKALRLIAGNVCIDAAQQLETNDNKNGKFNLHLRRAKLSPANAEILSQALSSLTSVEAPSLHSFSLSYNSELGDAGAAVIARVLPTTLGELGLVDCAIEDEGGAVLLQWMQRASGLRMICIEGNSFSGKMKAQFHDAARSQGNVVLYI